MLERAWVQASADRRARSGLHRRRQGPESVDCLGRAYEIDQAFARNLSLSDGLESAALLPYASSGERLTREQGAPIRLVVPSWCGVSNVEPQLFGGRLMDT